MGSSDLGSMIRSMLFRRKPDTQGIQDQQENQD
jgi:hypothetical protein